jgi:hypothetical protein
VLVLSSASARAGNVLVVAPSGAPFADIQSAISASSNDDVILVKTGTYPGFSIGDQSLSVVEDTGATVMVQGAIHVGPAAASRKILLSGLEVTTQATATSAPAALTADSVAGTVQVQDCLLTGASATASSVMADGSAGARFTNCPEVMVAHCSLFGGASLYGDVFGGPAPGEGGAGLAAVASDVALYDVTLLGGHGETAQTSADGGNGGVGLDVINATVFASRAICTAGAGGDGPPCPFSMGPCWFGGNGGDAVHVSGGTLTTLACLFQGGSGGAVSTCAGCSPLPGTGMPGTVGGPMTVLSVPGGARHLTCTSVAREQGAITLTVTGITGDQVGLLLSYQPDHQFVAPWNGVLAASTTATGSRWVRIGTIGGAGTLTRTFTQPDLGPGVQSQVRWLQIRVAAPGGANVLGPPAALVALDAAF